MSGKMEKLALPVKGAREGKNGKGEEQGIARERLLGLLERYFGHSSFRGRQLEAIEAVLAGQDCFCLMPTGGGKSMCYTIPALARPGVVLVVSPLIALIENQVSALKAQRIDAEHLSSTQGAKIKARVYEQLESGKPKLRMLYVTPELVATKGFVGKIKKLHGRGLLSLIAIDEAHCISSWGHDFRPSYRKLSVLRSQLPDVPILALTATAAKKVQDDIVISLALRSPQILISSFNRPNIYYEVRYKDLLKNSYQDLRKLVMENPGDCCIIYCHSRATCDEVGLKLLGDNVSCTVYHAGVPAKERSLALEQWSSGKIPIVIATVAFGMGIDRKDVRMVCHYNVPKSLEGFYQESGRAGRDGMPAKSVIYYGLKDKSLLQFLASKPEPRQKKQDQAEVEKNVKKNVEAFSQMVRYCEEPRCRRQNVLAHFGEHVSTTFCSKTCDSCAFQSRVAASLEDLARASFTQTQARFSSYISATSGGGGRGQDPSEFWDDTYGESDDEGSEAEDDIEDDEATVEAMAAVSKRGLDVDKRTEALLQAERAYAKRFGNGSDGSKRKEAASDKKTITQAFRDACVERLRAAVGQATLRLGMNATTAGEAANALEGDCFRSYGKAGKPFYTSQIASTTRWLASCSSAELESRARLKKSHPLDSERENLLATNDSASGPKASITASETTFEAGSGSVGNVEVVFAATTRKLVEELAAPVSLPPIPSFKDFLGSKKPLSSSSSSRGPGAPFKKPRRLDNG